MEILDEGQGTGTVGSHCSFPELGRTTSVRHAIEPIGATVERGEPVCTTGTDR